MVLDPANNTEAANSRAGSTMDIAPTVLELMGFDVAQWGLGRSLLREELTVMEREQDPDGFLRTLHPAIAKFWDWPHLDDMVVDTDQGSLMIGKRKISIPALLVLSRDRDIAEIHFDRDLHYRLSSTLPELAANDKLIWIDHCRDIAVVDINGDNTGGDGKNFCLYAGSLNSDSPLVTTVENLALIKKAKLMAALENSGHSSRLYRQRMARAEQMSTLDTLYVSTVTADDSIGQWLAKSGGGSGNESFLRPLTGDTGSELHFKRGLTLVALPAQGNSTELTEATKLLYIDSCEPTEEEANQSFAATIERYKELFSTYLIVANDSANCSNMDFAPLFEGLPLKLWPDIGFRQPYLALITEGEVLDEQLGNAGEAVALRVQ
jgi:hypothetical protein